MPSTTIESEASPTATTATTNTISSVTSPFVVAVQPYSSQKPQQLTATTTSTAATATVTTTVSGRWTTEEEKQFEEATKLHGRNVRKIAEMIPTRSVTQVRSHAQYCFRVIDEREKAEKSENNNNNDNDNNTNDNPTDAQLAAAISSVQHSSSYTTKPTTALGSPTTTTTTTTTTTGQKRPFAATEHDWISITIISTSRTFTLTVQPTTCVQDVKMMCGVVTSVKPWHKLFHAGVEMDERERLQDYGVQANAVVYLACGGKDAPPPIIKSTADNNNNNSNSNNNNNNNNKRFRPLKGKPLGDVLVRTGRTAPQPKYSEEADDEIVVRIKHGIVPAAFRVNRHSTKMRTVFELFANQCGCPVDRLKFSFGSEHVDPVMSAFCMQRVLGWEHTDELIATHVSADPREGRCDLCDPDKSKMVDMYETLFERMGIACTRMQKSMTETSAYRTATEDMNKRLIELLRAERQRYRHLAAIAHRLMPVEQATTSNRQHWPDDPRMMTSLSAREHARNSFTHAMMEASQPATSARTPQSLIDRGKHIRLSSAQLTSCVNCDSARCDSIASPCGHVFCGRCCSEAVGGCMICGAEVERIYPCLSQETTQPATTT